MLKFFFPFKFMYLMKQYETIAQHMWNVAPKQKPVALENLLPPPCLSFPPFFAFLPKVQVVYNTDNCLRNIACGATWWGRCGISRHKILLRGRCGMLRLHKKVLRWKPNTPVNAPRSIPPNPYIMHSVCTVHVWSLYTVAKIENKNDDLYLKFCVYISTMFAM